MLEKKQKKQIRHRRVRAKIKGTKEIPRLLVFRSNKFIYTQIIDDNERKTILSANEKELNLKPQTKTKKLNNKKEADRSGKIAIAYEVGKLIAKKALDKKIKKVVFDRGGYKYHGRVKAVAEGAREGGLKF